MPTNAMKATEHPAAFFLTVEEEQKGKKSF